MHPIVIEFDYFSTHKIIGTYGVLILLGAIIGVYSLVKSSHKFNISKSDAINYSVFTGVFILLFAALIGFILFLPERLASPQFLKYPLAIVSWGGPIGAFISLFIIHKLWKENILKMADFLVSGGVLAHAFGRIGCFFGGCCYGIHSNATLWGMKLGVKFSHPLAPASHGIQPVLPTQLYESVFLFILFFILKIVENKKYNLADGLIDNQEIHPTEKKETQYGTLLFIYLLAYPTFRFFIEFIRNDQRQFFMGFSDAQVFSIVAIVITLIVALFLKNRKM